MRDELLQELLAIDADEVLSWSDADQRWYAEQIRLRTALRSPADFAMTFSNGQWLPYRHLVHTSDEIVAMTEDDEFDCLIVEEPIRHGKSELCSKWTPAWFECKNPLKRTLLSSYEADFAASWGRKVREIIAEVGPTYGVQLDQASKAAARWDLDNGVGGMGTAGSGGPIIGKGGHLLIVDDPIKNFDEANSLVYREKLWDWWQNVWLGRREPGAKLIVIMSRWHQDDVVGRLLKHETGMRIKRLRMPVIAEDDPEYPDPLGRKPGEALCRERYDEEALAQARKDVGPVAWSSQWMQRPQARGGGILKPNEHLRYFVTEQVGESKFYQLDDALVDAAHCSRFATMDVAYSKSKRSDYTVMATCSVAPADPPALLIHNIERRRTTEVEHADMVLSTWRDWRPSWVGIEKQMAALSMFREVQYEGVVVKWLLPDKHKVARAETLGRLMENGRVWVPRDAPWLTDFIDELANFPVGVHDDQVDAVAYAAIELAQRHVHPRGRPHRELSRDEQLWEKVLAGRKTAGIHPVLGRRF